MFSEGRLTRSRARTLESAQGETPLVALPEGKTPGTRSRTARKAAEAPTPRAALFDLTNAQEEVAPPTELPPLDETKAVEFGQPAAVEEQLAAVEEPDVVNNDQVEVEEGEIVGAGPPAEAAPAAEASPVAAELAEEALLAPEDSVECAAAPEPAEEPPTTPPPAAVPSPACPAAAAPTPTGLGLSSLAPMSPLGPTILLSANTPAATPLQGVPTGAQYAKAYDTLAAAAQVFAEQEAREAGFGSPVKYSESPATSVSIAGAIMEEGAVMEEEAEACSGSPAGGSEAMASPTVDLRVVAADGTAGPDAPALMSPLALDEAHNLPLDLAMEGQVQADEDEAEATLAVEEASMAVAVEEASAASKPRVLSKVVATSPYDPRSLRQLRAAIKQKEAEKEAASAANSEEEEEEYWEEGEEYGYAEQGGDALLDAMGALNLGSPALALGPYDLHGVPKPQGKHTRFNDDGTEYVSPRLKTLLRGMPTPHGKHMFFEDGDE